MDDESKSSRGFGRMASSRQREIASKGGKAAHAKGKAHVFTSEEARAAGRLGGLATFERKVGVHAPRAQQAAATE